MKKIEQTIHEYSQEKKIMLVLLAIIVMLCFSYAYMVNKTVWNVVTRKNTTAKISAVTNQVSQLEYSYITLKNAVSINNAYALGFKDANDKDTTYVSRPTFGKALSINKVE